MADRCGYRRGAVQMPSRAPLKRRSDRRPTSVTATPPETGYRSTRSRPPADWLQVPRSARLWSDAWRSRCRLHPSQASLSSSMRPQGRCTGDGTSGTVRFACRGPPHVPSVARSVSSESGWIPVDPRTLSTSADKRGPSAMRPVLTLPNGKPLPKAAVFAEAQAAVVAHGVARHPVTT